MQRFLFPSGPSLPSRDTLLSVLSGVFFGLALGRILVTAGSDLPGNYLIQGFLIAGACLFSSYLVYLRQAARGIIRTPQGKLRPQLREMVLCAALNGTMLILAVGFFIIKPL